jgi:hypothetical protein
MDERGELDPCRRMVAGIRLASNGAIYTGSLKSVGGRTFSSTPRS